MTKPHNKAAIEELQKVQALKKIEVARRIEITIIKT